MMKSPESTEVSLPPKHEEHGEFSSQIGSNQSGAPSTKRFQWAQSLLLAVLYAAPALMCLRGANVSDPDVWWHLRTGEWILQHQSVPHTDPFSSFGSGKPWAAYSWLFELLIFQLFHRLGLLGVVAYTTGMVAAITIALHRMLQRLQTDFSIAVLLTIVACFCLSRVWTPRSWLFTILFFVVELNIVLQVRKSGKTRQLIWLPVLFALWANLHIQFIDGLVVLGIAFAESVLAQRMDAIKSPMRIFESGGVLGACILATFVNPYGWKIYKIAYDLATQPGVLFKISELQAMAFRDAGDWAVLVLVLAAVVVLARAPHLSLFNVLLLAFSIYVSFRSDRDIWVVVIVASAILATHLRGDIKNRYQVTASFAPFIAVVSGLLLVLGSWMMHVNNARLRTQMEDNLPVRAVETVKAKGLNGPLYNDYNWGGYLIWALRLPVSIDGRADLDGDQRIDRSAATWNAQPNWASDPDLIKAGLVIGSVKAPLIQLLRLDPRFELAFEDKLSAVFVRRKIISK